MTGLCAAGADLKYWIEPCTRPETKCQEHDPQMAEWALQDWARASGGALRVEKTMFRSLANIRIHWASQNEGLYGEAVPFFNGEIRGWEVYVLPDLSAMGPAISRAAATDPLLRDAIVFLTCLHETGHALGVSHTDAFADIMYSFQYGGDIPEYFGRFRRRLQTRADIRITSAISPNDKARFLAALSRN